MLYNTGINKKRSSSIIFFPTNYGIFWYRPTLGSGSIDQPNILVVSTSVADPVGSGLLGSSGSGSGSGKIPDPDPLSTKRPLEF